MRSIMPSDSTKKPITVTDDNYDKPLRRALFFGALTVVAVAVLGVAVTGIVVGTPGVWGALLGAAIAAAFTMITVAVGLATKNLSPNAQFGVIMGSWILKILVLLVVLVVLQGMDFYDRPSFAIVLLVSLVAILVAETIGIKNARVPYVQPGS